MRKFFLLLAITISVNCYSQNITIANLIQLGNRVVNPYNASAGANAALDSAVLDLIPQGFALYSFYDSTELISGNRLKTKSLHVFNNTTDASGSESINILTAMYDGSGFTHTVNIMFNTNDFATYQQWIQDIRGASDYALFNLNSLGQYLYRNNHNGKTITIGMTGKSSSSQFGAGNTTQNWQADTPFKYYCSLMYH